MPHRCLGLGAVDAVNSKAVALFIEQLDAVFTGMMREIDTLMERTRQQEDKLKELFRIG